MHGLGNDYVCIDARRYPIDDPAAAAVRLTDRRQGVGADGLILLLAPSPGVKADLRMRIFNIDGSESEMCGNGIRCVCKLARESGLAESCPMHIETGRGVLELDYVLDRDGGVGLITVDMGQVILDPDRIPVVLPTGSTVIDVPMPVGLLPTTPADWTNSIGLDERMSCLSTGNPHLVLFCQDVARVPLGDVGPQIECHELFPNRINVHFVEVCDREHLRMRSWERGSGATQACGTGASAVCVAAAMSGRARDSVTAQLPGGELYVRWDRATNHVFMKGEAVKVFTGEIVVRCLGQT